MALAAAAVYTAAAVVGISPERANGGRSAGDPPGPGPFAVPTKTYTDPLSGFTVAVPTGWSRWKTDDYVMFTLPASGTQPDVTVSWYKQSVPRNSVQFLTFLESVLRKREPPGYTHQRLERVETPDGAAAAEWEYTYLRDGTPWQVLERAVDANGIMFVVRIRAPLGQWAEGAALRHAVVDSFRTLSPSAAPASTSTLSDSR